MFSYVSKLFWFAVGAALFVINVPRGMVLDHVRLAWGHFRRCALWLIPHNSIYVEGRPYLTRFFLGDLLPFKPRVWLHWFHASDPGRALHNHPWVGTSIILKGAYWEESCQQVGPFEVYTYPTFKRYSLGMINRIGMNTFHRVELVHQEPVWTLFFPGRRVREWGFLDNRDYSGHLVHCTGDFTPWNQYLPAQETGYDPSKD